MAVIPLDESGLSVKQRKAIPIILANRSIASGLRKANIPASTFYDWMKGSDFRAEFQRQQQQLLKSAWDDLKALSGEAVKVLESLLHAEAENVRLRACLGILERVAEIAKIEDLTERISRLEDKIKSLRNSSLSYGGKYSENSETH